MTAASSDTAPQPDPACKFVAAANSDSRKPLGGRQSRVVGSGHGGLVRGKRGRGFHLDGCGGLCDGVGEHACDVESRPPKLLSFPSIHFRVRHCFDDQEHAPVHLRDERFDRQHTCEYR